MAVWESSRTEFKMEDELVNYTLRMDKAFHRKLKVMALHREMDMRQIFLEGADLWLEKYGERENKGAVDSRKEKDFVELCKHFFEHGNEGQLILFRMALEHHRKKYKLP